MVFLGTFHAAKSYVSGDYAKRSISLINKGISYVSPGPFASPSDALTYEPYFGLSEKPFSLNTDPRFVYESQSHLATSRGLLAGIRRREGLLVLTGEIGTGKTTVCRAVLGDLGRNTYSSLVPDPFASREDLLKTLLIDFGVVSIEELTGGPLRQASRMELGYVLAGFLDSLSADAFVVVILDEAQNLSLPLIEETRILSDTFGARGRLQIVFVGQPELHAKLKLPEMRQVDQRIYGYHRLAPMTREAVAGYVQHRLRVAGAWHERVLFPPDVIETLHLRSGGVPRLINRICDRALHIACERLAQVVDREILNTALIEIGAATLSPTWDSIIFSTPAPPISVAPVAPAPAAKAAPAVDDDVHFDKQIDQWVEKDLGPPARPVKPLHEILETDEFDLPAPKRPAPTAATRHVKRDWPRNVRSETYLSRLSHVWMKWVAIVVAMVVAVNVALVGIAVHGETLTPPVLPALPNAPARAVPGIAMPVPADAPIAVEARSQ